MIARLRRRMTLLVIAVIVLVTAGIVFFINYMNWREITAQAQSALEVLSSNSGTRPGLQKGFQDRDDMPDEEPPAKPDGEEPMTGTGDGEPPAKPDRNTGRRSDRSLPGQPPEMENALASLSNYYVVTLSSDDTLENWTSDRSDLYTDEQVHDMTAAAAAAGKKSGRFGTQFYRLTEQDGKKQLIVLDQRLEVMRARSVLRTTVLIAAAACLLLCLAAYQLIRVMVRPVQEAFDKQKQFVSDASHELKTPLAVIGANAQVLADEIGEHEQLSYIRSEVRRTDRLVQDLLTLARMDQGTQAVRFGDIDLGKTVLSVALPFESTAFEEGKTFDMQVPEGIICHADEGMIQQLCIILLGNAFKYADRHGQIEIAVGVRGKLKEIRVSNTGEGIPQKDIKKIFDRFYRADSSHNRAVEGYGLGLAIAANIVNIHKGKIQAFSEESGKTVFQVLLP